MRVEITNTGSSAISSVTYELGSYEPYELECKELIYGTLTITYTNGRTYEYEDVMLGVVSDMLVAESLGKFVNEEVKPVHDCRALV